jgi:PAS domain S-box-containing protein
MVFLSMVQAICSIFLLVLVGKASTGSREFRDNIVYMLESIGITHHSKIVEEINEDEIKVSLDRLASQMLEARRREEALIEIATDVVCIVDAQGRFLGVSPACEGRWGYTDAELKGVPVAQILLEAEAEGVKNSIALAARSTDRIVFESKLRHKDGTILNMVWAAHWSEPDAGVFCTVHDCSEIKRAEMLVSQNEERLRVTLQALPAGVLIVGDGGRIEQANHKACRLFRCTADEVTGRPLNALFANNVVETFNEQGSTTLSPSIETTARRQDGTVFPAEVSIGAIQVIDTMKLLAVVMDKTAQKELEQMKRDFMAMISHDLRSPLSSLQVTLELVSDGTFGSISENGKTAVTKAERSVKTLVTMVNDLLEVEKLERGGVTLELKPASFSVVAQEAIDMVNNQARKREINIVCQCRDLTAQMDADLIRRVFVNLLGNAIKFSPNNASIQVTAQRVFPSGPDDPMIRVTVRDQGPGIPADKLGLVFEKFQQVGRKDAGEKAGTGLGLAICRTIVEAHRGEIGVDSKVGEGSSFWFELPAGTET